MRHECLILHKNYQFTSAGIWGHRGVYFWLPEGGKASFITLWVLRARLFRDLGFFRNEVAELDLNYH